MEWYRIANLIMQAAYMPVHLALIVRLIVKRQPTPIWRWFTVVVTGLWVMISGRLLESVAYMFFPSNGFYTFAVYYQLVGTTFATSAYLIWNLYLAGYDKLSESRVFKAFMMTLSLAVSLTVCTTGSHHLFYEKLVMGEQVVHGKLFLPCLLIVYGTLFIGWLVSVINIIKHGKQKIKRLAVFSLYPILPAAAALIRSISGVDELDYMPIIMTVSILCLYLMVFRYRYVDIISQSIENALDQTKSALFIYDANTGEITYRNKACDAYSEALSPIMLKLAEDPNGFESVCGGKSLRVSVSPADKAGALIVSVTDMTELAAEQKELECEIDRQKTLLSDLEDKKRNIDAYLDSMYEIPHLKEKTERLTAAQEDIAGAFAAICCNLSAASERTPSAEEALRENLRITKSAIASVRAAVTGLREGE